MKVHEHIIHTRLAITLNIHAWSNDRKIIYILCSDIKIRKLTSVENASFGGMTSQPLPPEKLNKHALQLLHIV